MGGTGSTAHGPADGGSVPGRVRCALSALNHQSQSQGAPNGKQQAIRCVLFRPPSAHRKPQNSERVPE
eukprot:scaffold2182_cov118-Isochrysis_galbana.AAC.5